MAGKSKSKVKPQKPSAAPAWTRRFQQPPKRPRLPKMPNLLWLLKWTVLLLALFLRSYKPDLDLELDGLLPVLPNGENSVKTALVVTAHPDDEAMFFAPTILALVRHGWQVDGLCLSTGDQAGLGDARRQELVKSYGQLGVPAENVQIVDDSRLQDGMDQHWDASVIQSTLQTHLNEHPASLIITFDKNGISQHPNHRALPHALTSPKLPASSRVLLLRSPGLLGKFTGPLYPIYHIVSTGLAPVTGWLPFGSTPKSGSSIGETIIVVSSGSAWVQGWMAMLQHRTQLVWFRWLYLFFSRLMWVNELVLAA
ncbi:putative deacetylase LmbE-like domain-containing protein [Papiliotrema laurentii]|uniref:N-acetylglucosaminylphosphatidylinositol deacetylase n=1 Tax=Papiliotrema laurentii TaxID=5418 RepID=A0AAD9FSP5_PAPLA|nr:putative deacetylase LmbE-like domain-containing protein [Papiliotrema laurentii]